MMTKFYCIFFLVFAALFSVNGHADKNSSKFTKSTYDNRMFYHKKEPEGSVSTLSFTHDGRGYMAYVYAHCKNQSWFPQCARRLKNEIPKPRIKNIGTKAADSLLSIIKHNNLGNTICSEEKILVMYYEHGGVVHAPFIRYINDDDSYPANIMKTYKRENNKAYRAMLKNKILESNIYLPLQNRMREFGYQMKLSGGFTDGWRLNTPKKYFIDKGFFKKDEAKKEYYPNLKYGIFFDFNCKNKEQKNID